MCAQAYFVHTYVWKTSKYVCAWLVCVLINISQELCVVYCVLCLMLCSFVFVLDIAFLCVCIYTFDVLALFKSMLNCLFCVNVAFMYCGFSKENV